MVPDSSNAFSRQLIWQGVKKLAYGTIIDWADANRNDFDFLITSEKDLVKLQTASLANYALYALSIQMNIRKGEEELRQIINEKVRGKHLSARFTEGEQYV